MKIAVGEKLSNNHVVGLGYYIYNYTELMPNIFVSTVLTNTIYNTYHRHIQLIKIKKISQHPGIPNNLMNFLTNIKIKYEYMTKKSMLIQ